MAAGAPGKKAIIFDLDEVLLDTRRAWQYVIEESVALVCNRRVNAEPLVGEYRGRPWLHALAVLVESPAERRRCAELCVTIFERSAMKRLLVHEGIGMGLDAVRAGRMEMGAISRRRHSLALKQVQSTGLDRFVTVLSATPEGEPWAPGACVADCLRFLEREPGECVFVGCARFELGQIAGNGIACFEAAWATAESAGFPALRTPAAILAATW